jgi:hypothetical protein
MMGIFMEEEKKEVAKAGLKNLGIEIAKENPEASQNLKLHSERS